MKTNHLQLGFTVEFCVWARTEAISEEEMKKSERKLNGWAEEGGLASKIKMLICLNRWAREFV